MLSRIGHILTFLTLVALLLTNGVSREFIHQFTNHEDTVHHHNPNDNGVAHFESEHHHCQFLDVHTTPAFYFSCFSFSFTTPVSHGMVYTEKVQHQLLRFVVSSLHLRGPPAISLA